jgi:hypothetical protein
MPHGPAYHGRTHSPGGTDPIPTVADDAIRFDVYPQAGNSLHIATDTVGPAGAGITLSDTSVGGTGIDINAVQGIRIGGQSINIGPNWITAQSDGVSLTVAGSSVGGIISVNLANGSGTVFRIIGGSGTPILEVRDDDTFHIKTGATWATDL